MGLSLGQIIGILRLNTQDEIIQTLATRQSAQCFSVTVDPILNGRAILQVREQWLQFFRSP